MWLAVAAIISKPGLRDKVEKNFEFIQAPISGFGMKIDCTNSSLPNIRRANNMICFSKFSRSAAVTI